MFFSVSGSEIFKFYVYILRFTFTFSPLFFSLSFDFCVFLLPPFSLSFLVSPKLPHTSRPFPFPHFQYSNLKKIPSPFLQAPPPRARAIFIPHRKPRPPPPHLPYLLFSHATRDRSCVLSVKEKVVCVCEERRKPNETNQMIEREKRETAIFEQTNRQGPAPFAAENNGKTRPSSQPTASKNQHTHT